MYEIDRKAASKLLKVSVRTVDRYIAKNKLKIFKRDGRIWLDKKELQRLKGHKEVDSDVDMSTPAMSIDRTRVIPVDTSIDNDDTVYSHDAENSPTISQKRHNYRVDNRTRNVDISESTKSEIEEQVYKRLFTELQQELKEKQERLEGANYRVGQLEARLKDSVPLLDYNRALTTERTEKEAIRKNLDAQQFESEQLINALKEEKFNKKVYLIILFILLLLQPLWFFFPIK
ncbi:MAG: hypothetical protein WC843_02460 [Candidatus Gracilibacteria bacterium]|jgi:hypothetical protein